MGELKEEMIYISSSEEEPASPLRESAKNSNGMECELPQKCFFFNYEGEPLSFVLCLRKCKDSVEYTKLIEDHFGAVKRLKDFGDYDAVLVDNDCFSWSHTGDVFQVKYIKDCLRKGVLLNIGDYRLNKKSKFLKDFNYMDIIYNRLFTWSTVPEKFLDSKPTVASTDTADILLDDDSLPETDSSLIDKRTHLFFTTAERKAIVNYVFQKKKFDLLKGNSFWKEMERRNICPIRTWQSMKNHFLRSLVKNLHQYNIPEKDMKEFKRWHYPRQFQR